MFRMLRSGGKVRAARLATAALLAFLAVGCEDDRYYDHVPAPGTGSLVVDNQTGDDLDLYINGQAMGRIRDFDDRAVDLEPGLQRIVLTERDGRRAWRDDVDVLLGRLTVLRVSRDLDDIYAYNVSFEIAD